MEILIIVIRLLFALYYVSWQQRTLYSVSGGPALTIDSVGFFRFLLFFCFFISLPICQPICVSVGLFAIHLKFLKARYYEILSDLPVKN